MNDELLYYSCECTLQCVNVIQKWQELVKMSTAHACRLDVPYVHLL